MYSENGVPLKDVKIGAYMSLLNVCQDGYSLSGTPVLGFDNSEVLARINECHPLTSTDGSYKSEILTTVFNIGLKKLNERLLWIVPNSIRYRKYSPIKKKGEKLTISGLESPQSTLHRQLASLVKKEDKAILKFANKYGLLKRCSVHDLVFMNRDTGQQFQLGESLLWWKEEIEDLATCLELWDMVLAEDEKLKDIVLWHRDGIVIRLDDRHVQLVGRANMNLLGKWSKGDIKGPALYYLSLEADKRLINALTPKLLSSQTSEICLFPDSLLATIWLMFLLEISGKTRFIQCQSCGVYFDTRDPRARFCSTRCRMRNYRKRGTCKSRRRKEAKGGEGRRDGLNGMS
jgi:hypothetical protein